MLANTKVYRIKLRRWKILRNINFRAPKCAKNDIFWALLIFEHSWYAKINGIKVLPNMSKSKDNQTKQLSQLIEYNIRNIFMKKIVPKYGAETISRPFSQKQKLIKPLDQNLEVLQSSFLLFVLRWGLSKDIETILQAIYFNLTQSFKKKQKKVWN